MEKADQIVKSMRAMVEESNSDSLPNAVTVDKKVMLRLLDELEMAMNQPLEGLRALIELGKRLPLTNIVIINRVELMRLLNELESKIIWVRGGKDVGFA